MKDLFGDNALVIVHSNPKADTQQAINKLSQDLGLAELENTPTIVGAIESSLLVDDTNRVLSNHKRRLVYLPQDADNWKKFEVYVDALKSNLLYMDELFLEAKKFITKKP